MRGLASALCTAPAALLLLPRAAAAHRASCRARAHRRRRRNTLAGEEIFNISISIFSTFYISNFNILSSQFQHFES